MNSDFEVGRRMIRLVPEEIQTERFCRLSGFEQIELACSITVLKENCRKNSTKSDSRSKLDSEAITG